MVARFRENDMQPDTAAPIIARYPGPVTLLPQRRRWQIVLAFNAVFIALGFIMMLQGQRLGIYVVLAFAAIAFIPAMVALPGAAKLALDRDGFTATSLYRGKHTRWTDVSEFQIAQMSRGGHRIVVYDDASLTEGSHLMSGSQIAGRNSALPDTYGLTAEELAKVLNHWRMQALEGASLSAS
jgi:hypothetical protein